MRICKFEGCGKAHYGHGLCVGHCKQLREGKELKPLRKVGKHVGGWTAAKILAEAIPHGDCLLFRPYCARNYVVITVNGKSTTAHRLVFAELSGGLEPGAQVHHKCATTKCVNPEHLERVSHAENVGEMLARRDYEAKIANLEAKVAALEAQLEKEWELV